MAAIRPSAQAQRLQHTGDRIGMWASLVCAVHCALLPLVLALLPMLGLGALDLVDIDQAFVVFATVLGVTTLALGYRRHRAFGAWALLLPGLALVSQLYNAVAAQGHARSGTQALIVALKKLSGV